LKDKVCICGANLDKAKRAGRVQYWVVYRVPGGKQKSEKMTGKNANSIEYARDVEAKRKVQKREKKIFPEVEMTIKELKDWYLGLEKTKALRNYLSMKSLLEKFSREFGSHIVNTIRRSELENLQVKRQKEGMAPATIDYELNAVKIMVNKAFNDDLLGGDTLKVFKGIKQEKCQCSEQGSLSARILSDS
jgi:hypothetical protein